MHADVPPKIIEFTGCPSIELRQDLFETRRDVTHHMARMPAGTHVQFPRLTHEERVESLSANNLHSHTDINKINAT